MNRGNPQSAVPSSAFAASPFSAASLFFAIEGGGNTATIVTLDRPRVLLSNAATRSRFQEIAGYDATTPIDPHKNARESIRATMIALYVMAVEADPSADLDSIISSMTIESMPRILGELQQTRAGVGLN